MNKLISKFAFFSVLSSFSYFTYKYYIYHEEIIIDFDETIIKSKNSIKSNTLNDSTNNLESYIINNDPFKVLKKIDKEEYLLNEYFTLLYVPCLTNKLFVSTNLYGHELIRYYDF